MRTAVLTLCCTQAVGWGLFLVEWGIVSLGGGGGWKIHHASRYLRPRKRFKTGPGFPLRPPLRHAANITPIEINNRPARHGSIGDWGMLLGPLPAPACLLFPLLFPFSFVSPFPFLSIFPFYSLCFPFAVAPFRLAHPASRACYLSIIS